MENWTAVNSAGGSLFVQQCGSEVCEFGHQYGPVVRGYHLIHFVASGSGVFWTRERRFELSKGQGFIIYPDQVTTYRADDKTPWAYAWVGFAGYDAELLTRQAGLSRAKPVFSFEQAERVFGLLRRMPEDAANLRLGAMAALGGLYQVLALIGQGQPQESPNVDQSYYKKAMWYMEGNYERPIQISDVADFVGLSRSQLFRVFQKVAGAGPKDCLTHIRMKRAQMLLGISGLTLEEIASSVGVSSAARLGVLFKETYGITVGQYRRSQN